MIPSTGLKSACLLAGLFATTSLHAADWPQYRGPNLDGSTSETISARWPATGPKVVWRVPTPGGFSSFTVVDGRAFTVVKRMADGADQEVLIALNADSGKELWSAALGVSKYDGGGDAGTPDNKGGDGPRSTPTVDGGRVYVMSANLQLTCHAADSGKLQWKLDLVKDHGAQNIRWKNAASPLIDGDLIFVAGGGNGQALLGVNKTSGKVAWKGENDLMTHSTPVVATILGQRQVIFFTQEGLVSVAPATGKPLWRYKFRFNVSTAMTPVVAGDIVYCSAGYGVGAGAVKLTKKGAGYGVEEIYRVTGDKPLANHWSSPVLKDGHMYGMFQFKEYGAGPLKCVDVKTGTVKWEKEGFGPGNVILAGNHILALADDGQLVLVQASPAAYQEVARAKILGGKCWSTPVLSGGRIYVRSTTEAVCLDVSSASAAR